MAGSALWHTQRRSWPSLLCAWSGFDALADEAESDTQPGDLDEAAYVTLRRRTAGVPFYLDLVEFALHEELTDSVLQTPAFGELATATTDLVCWHNDLYSVDKEIARGNGLNLVLVLMRSTGCSRDQAERAVIARAAWRVEQMKAARYEFAQAITRQQLSEAARDTATRCCDGTQDWVNANLMWCRVTSRYSEVEHLAAGEVPSYMEDIMAPAV